jgi:lysophospholipid acyltransferase (LPLAT)-like uncharacterized protein
MLTATPSPKPMPKTQRPQRSGVVVPHRLRWHQRLAAALIYWVIRAISATIRYEWRDSSDHLAIARTQSVIFCIWHNRLALCLEVYRVFLRDVGRDRRLAAMVSASKDGGLAARIMEHYHVQPARGSSSRRGRQALLELLTWAERGYDLAITPDGPRGPRYHVQDGIISLAQVSGRPILPVSYHLTWKITVRSWDRLQIPLPFTKCLMHLTPPIYVPRELSEEAREKLRLEVEARLKSVTVD